MTKEKAMRLAAKWANGGVCTLREGEAQEYHELCLAALRESRQEWISVEERLPEVGVRVLVYRDGHFATSEIWAYDYRQDPLWDYTGLGGDPTHWMLLPEPPYMGDENQ